MAFALSQGLIHKRCYLLHLLDITSAHMRHCSNSSNASARDDAQGITHAKPHLQAHTALLCGHKAEALNTSTHYFKCLRSHPVSYCKQHEEGAAPPTADPVRQPLARWAPQSSHFL